VQRSAYLRRMESHPARERTAEPSDPLYPEGNAAAELNLSPKTLQAWRVSGCGPRFVKLGRRVFYRASDLRSFIEANTFQSTAEVDHARRPRTRQGPRS
jgi:hypothetical protein